MKQLFGKDDKITAGDEADHVLVVDVSNLAHRCAHAYKSLTTGDGKPSGHVYGATTQMLSLIKNRGNVGIVFALDGYPKWKYEKYPEYKGKRQRTLDFNPVDDVISVLSCIPKCRIVFHPDEEADDTIASFVQNKRNTVVVSSDKDLWQLYPHSKVHVPKKGHLTDEDIHETFGVDPYKIPLHKAVYGDPSDNIKGVPRLLKKQVTPIIAESDGTVNDFLGKAADSRLTDQTKQKIEEHKELIQRNYELACLRKGIEFETNNTQEGIDNLKTALHSFECRSLVDKVEVLQ